MISTFYPVSSHSQTMNRIVFAVGFLAMVINSIYGCADTNSNCGNWVRNGFCSSSFYTPAQKASYCAGSCNLCNGAVTSSSSCADSNSNCATWVANGFCTSTAYTADQILAYCCGSCPNVATTAGSTTGSTSGGTDSTTGGTTDSTVATTGTTTDPAG
ncbi:unnamed protein product, partial [Mesorhabditis belari]|uniref:ShKT domain-containing protein n=1 Tax=Mesorhabditis belari TaxID=2138241 RepID=A0AAF3ENQ8_9BILA